MVAVIVIIIVALVVFVTLARTIRVVPQARAAVVERLGRYSRTLSPGLTLVVPFIDRIRATIDLREQVVSFPPQPVITEDNLVVSIDSVIYFQVTNRSRRRTRSRTTSRRSSSSRSRRCAT
jgi:regulator of protease activity HflC (stomatin/prohibitin superfamily)